MPMDLYNQDLLEAEAKGHHECVRNMIKMMGKCPIDICIEALSELHSDGAELSFIIGWELMRVRSDYNENNIKEKKEEIHDYLALQFSLLREKHI
jgi:hypothetical protein